MNLKLCKALRKTVKNLTAGKDLPSVRYVEKPHFSYNHDDGKVPKYQKLTSTTIVNDPQSKRGLYRFLKREARKLRTARANVTALGK